MEKGMEDNKRCVLEFLPEEIGEYRLRHEIIASKRALYGIRNAEAIAEKAKISVQAVRKVLSGKQQNPQLRTLVAICQALDLTLNEVVELESPAQRQE